jgi:hypothetical protein
MWIISVAGTLGGEAVQIGDSIIANTDNPGQTASNWNHLNANISYVPENIANKRTSFQATPTDDAYISEKLAKDSLDTKAPTASPTFTGTVTLPKAVNVKDTSADHEYQLGVSELAANRTVTLPLLTGNDTFMFKDFHKASASDINTGTEDNKYITPKAIKDSHNVPSVAPGDSGNVLTSDGTDWVSSAPSSGSSESSQISFIAGEDLTAGDAVRIYNPSIITTLDSYSESNVNTYDYALAYGNKDAIGQTFKPSVCANISTCKFYLKNNGATTGNAVAKIYAMTGTYGTNGVPTGSALATSNNYDVSGLTTSPALITFTFATPYLLIKDTEYCLTIEWAGNAGGNYIQPGQDSSSPSHGGNMFGHNTGGSYSAYSNYDAAFYVYGVEAAGYVYKTKANDTNKLAFIGFASETKTATQAINIDIAGANISQTELTIGSTYYLSDTAGSISSSAGTNSVKIGKAIDTTKILIIQPPLEYS